MKYVIGLDYGSDSCRAIVVNAETGEEIATSVKYYPRWMEGLYCNSAENRYRQHPLDYIETLEYTVREALSKSPVEVASQVVGLCFDTTGSTPALVDRSGTPLALLPQYAENPNAMFVLWKDHTATREASEINALAKRWQVDYTAYEGGIYSSEWVWAKMLHVLREDESIRTDAYAWVEHCDWMTALVTGNLQPETLYRSRCAAGHKAMWLEQWGGLPSEEFLTALDPLLAGMRDHLFTTTYPSNVSAGNITAEWAERLGLTTDVVVAVGAFDAHLGAVGAEIKPNTMVRIIGTSTCDIIVAPYDEMKNKLIPGICGQVDGSVLPGYIGLEAGQSAFGDLYAWFKRLLVWPIEHILANTTLVDEETRRKLIDETAKKILMELDNEAAKVPLTTSVVIATDWMNGRRTPDANQLLKGTITGLTLGSTAPMIYRALVEATAFGSKAILNRFLEQGVKIEQVIGIGGIAQKSPFVMQTLANVLERPIKVAKVEQACAFGAAMCAATAAGIYPTIEQAQAAMGQGFSNTYVPDEVCGKIYHELYAKYTALGHFSEIMAV